jgi:hypothetical protein
MIQPTARLRRMRSMFARSGGILAEDYEYFTRLDAAIPLNKAAHRSAKLNDIGCNGQCGVGKHATLKLARGKAAGQNIVKINCDRTRPTQNPKAK